MLPHSTSGFPSPRFLAFFSAVILSFALAACGGGNIAARDATVDSISIGVSGGGGMAMGGTFGGGGTGGNVGADGGLGGGPIGTGGDGGADDSATDGASDAANNGTTDGGADDSATDGASDAANNGAACSGDSECSSGHCVDDICCDGACALTCYTCASAANPGICVPADRGTDPHNECEDKGTALCQTNGVCDGFGSCRLYPAGTICNDRAMMCDPTNTGIITSDVCDGNGICGPAPLVDCKGFRCSNAACESSCTSDATCAPGAFCGAGGCVGNPFNLAGNGDGEYGTVNGWFSFAGAAPATLSSPSTAGIAHGGQHSVITGARTQNYQGPAYDLPTGPGRYIISFWGQQQADDFLTGVAQIQLTCASGTAQYLAVQTSGFGVSMPAGVWTQFSGTVDTAASSMPAECDPTATPPGVVRRAMLYLNQTAAGTPMATPDLFTDDLVVQVTDGHNLIGNPNFEAATTVGWAVAETGTPGVSSTIFNTGTMSMGVTARTTSTSGPSYPLPIGGARYNITFHALHTDTTAHDLVLQSSYTCLGGTQTTTPPIATAAALPGNTWATLSGTVTLPPLNATAGCKLIQAEVHVQQETGACDTIMCPDIYVDDASITLAQ